MNKVKGSHRLSHTYDDPLDDNNDDDDPFVITTFDGE